jgi:hypothetical protein
LDEDEDLNIGIDPWPIDKTGGFEIGNVPPGSYAVFLGAGQELMRTDPVIEVDDADVEGVRVTPLANGNIRGRFRMETDRIIDWTQFYVALVPAHWRPIASGTWGGRRYSMLPDEIPPRANVRSNGSFELKEVPAGSYRLSVTDGDEALPDYFVKAVNIGGQDVIESGFTTAGQQSLDVVVSAKGAAIDGVVLDDKDQPSGDVNVIVFPDEKRRGRSDLYHLVSTDAKGHFHLRGLSPGEYRIFALDEDVNGDEISDPDFVGSHEGLGRSITAVEGETESIVLKLGSASE